MIISYSNLNKTFKFHLIPSGILYKGKTCFIGAGTVILPEYFEEEVSDGLDDSVTDSVTENDFKLENYQSTKLETKFEVAE